MREAMILTHEFVEFMPDDPKPGIVYVCIGFATVVHRCCCGCGKEVVTPLSPTDWKLIFDGKTISLEPSIGNWGFECRSHYWIKRNRVRWADQWSSDEVEFGRARDHAAKQRYFQSGDNVTDEAEDAGAQPEAMPSPIAPPSAAATGDVKLSRWQRAMSWLWLSQRMKNRRG